MKLLVLVGMLTYPLYLVGLVIGFLSSPLFRGFVNGFYWVDTRYYLLLRKKVAESMKDSMEQFQKEN